MTDIEDLPAGHAFLRGGGEMGRRMRGNDWSGSPLGHPGQWPGALKTVVSLLLNSKFPMFIAWGEQLAFLYNDAYIDVLGSKHPAALGKPFDAVWFDIWDDIEPLIRRALAGESSYFEDLPLLMRRRGRDEQTWFTFSYSPVRDGAGAIQGMFCACTETTAHVLAQRARREENQRLHAMFEQAPGFMAVVRGPEHVFELTNSAYLQLVGHREVVGKAVADALPEVIDQGFARLLDEVYHSGQPFVGNAMRIALQRQPGGALEERFVDFVFQPMRDASGAISGVFVEGSDVTDRARAMQELQLSDRRKDEFLAMLAHELRNPLSPISSAAQLLRAREPSADVVRRASEIISRQVGHMTRLVDDLLDVSRVTRGLVALQREPVDIGEVVASAVEQVRPLLQAQRHRLTVVHAATPARVPGDRTRLVQVFANLLGNAAKFTPAGGEVSVHVRVAPDAVAVAVRDNGIGIDPQVLPYVFDLFAQGDRKPDRSQGGLGLGLSLVKSLVALHDGQAEAHSAGPGQGTEIVVHLPRWCDPVPAQADGRADAPVRHHRPALRILVVDDNVDAAHSLAALLEMEGHEVLVATESTASLALARSAQPQALVLDIGLPVLDGYALARRLRSMPQTRDALLVALTGYGQARDRENSRAAGFDHHLVKPVDMDRLTAVLDDFARRGAPVETD